MVHSRLPPPSLLCLFGALLMLSPELLMGNHKDFYNVSITDPVVQDALAFAVEKYNQDTDDSANYFKVLRVLYLQMLMISPDDYHLTMEFAKTICTKKGGRRKYKSIQECKRLPAKLQEETCYFVVKLCPPPYKMKLTWIACSRSGAPEDGFCSG